MIVEVIKINHVIPSLVWSTWRGIPVEIIRNSSANLRIHLSLQGFLTSFGMTNRLYVSQNLLKADRDQIPLRSKICPKGLNHFKLFHY
jgi:hypothetical protein